jgi:hypothetical protein
MIKSTRSWLRLRQAVEIYQKFQVSTDLLILIETFGTGKWCQDKIKIFDLDCGDKLNEIVKIFSSIETYFLPVLRLRHGQDKLRPPGVLPLLQSLSHNLKELLVSIFNIFILYYIKFHKFNPLHRLTLVFLLLAKVFSQMQGEMEEGYHFFKLCFMPLIYQGPSTSNISYFFLIAVV